MAGMSADLRELREEYAFRCLTLDDDAAHVGELVTQLHQGPT